jgi:diaminobutyrate-2-oxoglutarate transaminase
MNLINPEIDCWNPGEHNGTFRGNNLAFITAACALEYWINDELSKTIMLHADTIEAYFSSNEYLGAITLRGRGLMRGIELENEEMATRLQRTLFRNGILMDTCGHEENIVKIMPPITISNHDLDEGLEIICKSMKEVLKPSYITI